MKKKLFLCLIIISILGIFSGCSQNNGAKTAFDNYVNAWEKGKYSDMYKLLSSDSQKAISEKDFVAKYTNIYSGIDLSKISIVPTYPSSYKENSDGKIPISFKVTMNTIAGNINFTDTAYLKKSTNNSNQYTLDWTSQMIFPDLKTGDKVRVIDYRGKRGEITDRNGTYLAQNGTVASVGIVPSKLGSNSTANINQIAQILNVTPDSINKALTASYVTPDMFIPIAELSKDDPRLPSLKAISGIMTEDKSARIYPLKEAAAQLIGYVQPITADELSKLKNSGYNENSIIGKAGLEKIYESTLKATDGGEIYIVDKDGNKVKTIATKAAKDGQNIKLTIDANIQTAVYNELKNDPGAGVVLNPKTGEALALVSTPSYNPNDFVLGMSTSEWNSLNNDPKKPLVNRFQDTFAPGSTFKPLVASIALDKGKLDPNAAKNITGLKWQKDSSWGDYFVTRDETYTEPANLLNALVHSDNIYFAQTALAMGKDTFTTGLKALGIGEKIPFEYGLYNSQISSTNSISSDIQLADSGYGQGQVLMNPVQLAALYTCFVNNGNIVTPYLNSTNSTKIWKANAFTPSTMNIVSKDLESVVSSPEGTGYGAYDPSLPLAGKTGTAEIKASQTDTNGKENGWFIAYNTNNPKLLVLEMVQDAKNLGGSKYVVPKVKTIFEQFGK